jgi:hypothetical protein
VLADIAQGARDLAGNGVYLVGGNLLRTPDVQGAIFVVNFLVALLCQGNVLGPDLFDNA